MSEKRFAEEEFSGRLDWSVWRKILAFGRPYRVYFFIVAGSGAVTAFCDGGFALVTRSLVDEIAARGVNAELAGLAWCYLVLALLLSFSVGTFVRYAGRISTSVSHDIRNAGFVRLQELELEYFDRRSVGWLMTRLTSDCDRLSRVIAWLLLDVAWGSSFLGFITVIMLWLNWKLALLVLLVVPALAWVSLWFQKRLLASSRAVRKTGSRITAAFNEAINGVRTTKSLVREAGNFKEFQSISGRMFGESVRNAVQTALYLPVILGLVSVGTGLALVFGGYGTMAGGVSLGTLLLFMTYARQLSDPVQQLAQQLAQAQAAQAAAERVVTLLDSVPKIADSKEVRRELELRKWGYPRKAGQKQKKKENA